jgi:hypothetical protein
MGWDDFITVSSDGLAFDFADQGVGASPLSPRPVCSLARQPVTFVHDSSIEGPSQASGGQNRLVH